MKFYDTIEKYNDRKINIYVDMDGVIAEYDIGETIKIGIVRDNKMLSVEATLQEYKGE